jgi:hypothetical protein
LQSQTGRNFVENISNNLRLTGQHLIDVKIVFARPHLGAAGDLDEIDDDAEVVGGFQNTPRYDVTQLQLRGDLTDRLVAKVVMRNGLHAVQISKFGGQGQAQSAAITRAFR